MNVLIMLVIVILDWFILMVLIRIILKLVVFNSIIVFWVVFVILFSVFDVGDGWMQVFGCIVSCVIWVLLLRIDLFVWVDDGLIVSIVI